HVEHHADDNLAGSFTRALEADADGIGRHAAREVGRAVDGVDDPAVALARRVGDALFGEPAEAGERLGKHAGDDALGLDVDVGYEVVQALGADGLAGETPGVGLDDAGRLAGRRHGRVAGGKVKGSFILHGIIRYWEQEGASGAFRLLADKTRRRRGN